MILDPRSIKHNTHSDRVAVAAPAAASVDVFVVGAQSVRVTSAIQLQNKKPLPALSVLQSILIV